MARFGQFDDFWAFYLSEHRHPVCRAWHFVGSVGVLAAIAAAVTTRSPAWLFAAPVAGYGGAWIGHFGFERNRPATFKHPWRSLASDWRMVALMATGRLGGEFARRGVPDRPST